MFSFAQFLLTSHVSNGLNTKTIYSPDKEIKAKKKAPELLLKILKRNVILRDESTQKEKREDGQISTY